MTDEELRFLQNGFWCACGFRGGSESELSAHLEHCDYEGTDKAIKRRLQHDIEIALAAAIAEERK